MSPRFGRLAGVLPGFGILLAVGLGLRCYHYLSNPPVWHDEEALMVNVLTKGFGEHLGPLYYSEAAPPGFLWAEKLVALTAGDSTFAFRLLPLLASCAALVGAALLARRVLPAAAVLWLHSSSPPQS